MLHDVPRLRAVTPPLADAILVVDDDAERRQTLAEYLAFAGFTVHTAANGATAVEVADALRPHVILMDLAMAELDGLETTCRLRAHASTKDATIVAVAAHADEAYREAASRAGCNFFVPKPLDLAVFAQFVAELMSAGPQTAGRRPLNFAPRSLGLHHRD
jgi:CheY-like chemotaxis protein